MTRLSRHHTYLAPPPLPLLPLVNSTDDEQEDWEREITCWKEKGGGEDAKSYDGQTAWSSINDSTLSDPPQPLSTSQVSELLYEFPGWQLDALPAYQPFSHTESASFSFFAKSEGRKIVSKILFAIFTFTVFLSASKFSRAVFRIVLAILVKHFATSQNIMKVKK